MNITNPGLNFKKLHLAVLVLSFLLLAVYTLPIKGKENPAREDAEIRIIKPQGGEVWREGGVYYIKWQASGVEELILFAACGGKDKGYLKGTGEGVPAEQGFFRWQIPEDFASAMGRKSSNRVRLMLCSIRDNELCAVSNYFTVTGKKRTSGQEEFYGAGRCEQAIRKYYRAIEQRQYKKAYSMLSPCKIVLYNADGAGIAFQPRPDFPTWLMIHRNITHLQLLGLDPLLAGMKKEKDLAEKGNAKAILGVLTFRVGLRLELKQSMHMLHNGTQDLFMTLATGVDGRARILDISSGP